MLAHLTDRAWLWIAAGFYLAGFLFGTFSLLRGGRQSNVVTYTLVAAGYIFQLLGLYIRGMAVGGCPLGNLFEIYQFTAWSAITLYLVVGVTFRLSLLGYFTSCLAAVVTLVSLSIPSWDATRSPSLFGGNPWIEFHAALAIFSYGVFALLALTALMQLLRNYSLKNKNIGGWFSFLPSLIELDHISLRLLLTGTVLLTASLAVGSVYWLQNLGSVNHAKLFTTLAVWAAYGLVLVLRLNGRLIGKRLSWACLVLFIVALVSIAPVDSSRHPPPPPHTVPR